jgi:hypothetical protein
MYNVSETMNNCAYLALKDAARLRKVMSEKAKLETKPKTQDTQLKVVKETLMVFCPVKRQKVYKPEIRQQVLKMLTDGHKVQHIHKVTGVPITSINTWKRTNGIGVVERVKYTQEFKEQVCGMFDQGFNEDQVAAAHNIPLSTVSKWRRKYKKE